MKSSNEKASRMERFELLYHTQIQYIERFVKSSISLSSILMVLVGWLLTSTSAKTFFESSITGTVATSGRFEA